MKAEPVHRCRAGHRQWCSQCELFWTFWLFLQGTIDDDEFPALLRKQVDDRERRDLRRL